MQLLQAPLPPHLSFQCSKLHNSRRGSCLLENPLLPCPSLRLLAVTILLFTSRGRTAPPGRVWVMHLPTGVRPCSKLLPLKVLFQIELTTPACPVKDMFKQKANEVVAALPWVKNVQITMSAQPVKPVFAGLKLWLILWEMLQGHFRSLVSVSFNNVQRFINKFLQQ